MFCGVFKEIKHNKKSTLFGKGDSELKLSKVHGFKEEDKTIDYPQIWSV